MGRRDEAHASSRPLAFAHVGDLHLTDPAVGEPADRRLAAPPDSASLRRPDRPGSGDQLGSNRLGRTW